MASIVSVDNIRATGTSTNAITIDSSNVVGEMNIASEGGSASTSLQQGLAKTWVNFNGTGTVAARDSFNHSSITDHNTGDYTVTVTTAFANGNYAFSFGGGEHSDSREFHVQAVNRFESGTSGTAPTSTAMRFRNFYNGKTSSDAAQSDHTYICVTKHGDLA